MILVKHETAEGRLCSVEVWEGTLGDKLRRSRMVQETVRRQRGTNPEDVIEGLIELHTFPSCLACSRNLSDSDDHLLEIEGLTFADFCTLPEQFIEKWAKAVFEINPGWKDDSFFPLMRPSKKGDKTKSS